MAYYHIRFIMESSLMLSNSDNAWFHSAFGRWVGAQTQQAADKIAGEVTGQYGVQLGVGGAVFRQSALRHQLVISPNHPVLRADAAELPFALESLDGLALCHLLEAHPDPHAVLREAERTLSPEGRLLIIGFNPYSLLALDRRMPWRRNWIPLPRLKDWLRLLQLQPLHGGYAAYLPPWQALRYRRLRCVEKAGRRWWPMAGGVYALLAVKHRHAKRPLKPLSPAFAPLPVVGGKEQPAMSEGHHQ